MDNCTEYNLAKELFGDNFIGISELSELKSLNLQVPSQIPAIPFSYEELSRKKDDYLLILGVKKFSDGKDVNLRNLIRLFGKDPEISEPCFYNQDWYNNEDFLDKSLNDEWFLVRKDVYSDSRAVQPDELIEKYSFPSAIVCAYSFFVAWESKGMKLWYHDFVWCSDKDHNGDRIYVGKYHDVDGVNKNGFSIHRHLSLRPCYGCIDIS